MLFGSFIGIFAFGNILGYLFNTYEYQSKFAFMGLILGSVPLLLKKSVKDRKYYKVSYLLYTAFTFFLTLLLLYYEKISSNLFITPVDTSFGYIILSGFLMSIGVIVPGVSNTVILMCLGIYSSYLEAISSLNLRFSYSTRNWIMYR